MSLLQLRVGYMEQFTLFKTLSNTDKIPRFCSYSVDLHWSCKYIAFI